MLAKGEVLLGVVAELWLILCRKMELEPGHAIFICFIRLPVASNILTSISQIETLLLSSAPLQLWNTLVWPFCSVRTKARRT